MNLEVWQRKELRADFSDVWQRKELEDEKDVEEGQEVEDIKEGKTPEAVLEADWSATITAHLIRWMPENKLYEGAEIKTVRVTGNLNPG